MPIFAFHIALGYSAEQILDTFYDKETFYLSKDGVETELVLSRLKGETVKTDICDADGKVLVAAGKRVTAKGLRDIEKAGLKRLRVDTEALIGKMLAKDVIVPDTGEILAPTNSEITEELLAQLEIQGVNEIQTLYINELGYGGYISSTLQVDETADQMAARIAI